MLDMFPLSSSCSPECQWMKKSPREAMWVSEDENCFQISRALSGHLGHQDLYPILCAKKERAHTHKNSPQFSRFLVPTREKALCLLPGVFSQPFLF